MEDGNYIVELHATDLAGNKNQVTMEICVDNIKPWIDENDLTVSSVAWNRSVKVNFKADDDRSGVDLVDFYVDGVFWISTSGNTKEVWLEDTDLKGRNLTIMVKDRAGNINETTIAMDLDLVAPEFEFVYPPDGSYINTSSIQIRWHYDTSVTDLDTFMIRLDEGEWINAGAEKSHIFNVDEERTYNVTLVAYDKTGNMRTKTISFTVDRTAPTVELLSPKDGSSDVPLDTLVLFRFSEPVDPTSVHATMTFVAGSLRLENGTFIFAPEEKLKPDARYELSITGADLAGNWMGERKFRFQAQGLGMLEGVVIGSDGEGIKNAFISIDGVLTSNTDKYGAFSIRLPEGTYNVSVSYPGHVTWSSDVMVRWGARTDLGSITLVPIDGKEHHGDDDDDDLKLLVSGIVTFFLALVLVILTIYMIGLIRRSRYQKEMFEE